MGKLKGSVFSILGALVIGAVFIAVSGQSPLAAYTAVVKGSFGSMQNFLQVLAFTTPLIFTGLAAAVAFRAGVFNIGIEGQLVVGAFAGTLVGIFLPGPWPLPLIVSLLVGAAAGAVWALIPGLIVGRTSASLLVATIMMNSIGVLLVDYFLRYHFLGKTATTLETERIGAGAVLPRIAQGTQLTWGLLIGLALMAGLHYLLFHTTIGFALRSIGSNPDAARQAGIRVYRNTLLALGLSGALSGLGGAVVTLGVYSRFITDFSPGYGWDGITVAILAGNSPFAVLLSAGLFGMLRAASISMNFGKTISVDLISVLQGLIICFVAAPLLWHALRAMLPFEIKKTPKKDPKWNPSP